MKNKREPRWFPLIARAALPQALLSFRLLDGTYFGNSSLHAMLGVDRDKVMAGGTPANPATLGSQPEPIS